MPQETLVGGFFFFFSQSFHPVDVEARPFQTPFEPRCGELLAPLVGAHPGAAHAGRVEEQPRHLAGLGIAHVGQALSARGSCVMSKMLHLAQRQFFFLTFHVLHRSSLLSKCLVFAYCKQNHSISILSQINHTMNKRNV